MRLKLKEAPELEPISLDEAKLHLKVDAAADNALIARLITVARTTGEAETNRAFITQTHQLSFDQQSHIIEIPKPPLQSIVSIKTISAVESYVDENSASGQPILLIADTEGFAVDDTVVIDREGDREEEVTILSIQDDESLTMTTDLDKTHTAVQADIVTKFSLVPRISYYVDRAENSYGRVIPVPGYSWPAHRGFASFIVEFICGYGDAASDVPEALKEGIYILLGDAYENRGGVGSVKARVSAIEAAGVFFDPYRIRTF